ncbi:hypothetical protein AB4Y63_06890 [Leifsonia sp. YAF41]
MSVEPGPQTSGLAFRDTHSLPDFGSVLPAGVSTGSTNGFSVIEPVEIS